jgi:hypothetical protein
MSEPEVIEGTSKDIIPTYIKDERTGEEIERGAKEILSYWTPDYNKIGTLNVTDETNSVLDEKLNPDDIRIRPDGNIYVSWTWYADRLNRAFGRCKWGLAPIGSPKVLPGLYGDSLVTWEFALVINGVTIGTAIGEMTYKPSNPMMTYADACEGAKSNALARNCKVLGMTLEMWDFEFIDEWKKKYAETYVDDKNKTRWRMKKKSDNALDVLFERISEECRRLQPKIGQEALVSAIGKYTGGKPNFKATITTADVAASLLNDLNQL